MEEEKERYCRGRGKTDRKNENEKQSDGRGRGKRQTRKSNSNRQGTERYEKVMTQTVTCIGTHRNEERHLSGNHERRKEKTDVKLKVKDGDREKCRRVKGPDWKV